MGALGLGIEGGSAAAGASGQPADAMGTSIAVGQSAKHAISHLKICIVDGIFVINDPVVAAETRAILDINHAES